MRRGLLASSALLAFIALAFAAAPAPLCTNCVLQQGPIKGCEKGIVATSTVFNIPGACNEITLNTRLNAGQCAIYEFVAPVSVKYSGLSTTNIQLQMYSRAGRYLVNGLKSSGTIKAPSSYYRLVVQGKKSSTPNIKLNFCAPASDCSQWTRCDTCAASSGCGWCGASNTCQSKTASSCSGTLASTCSNAVAQFDVRTQWPSCAVPVLDQGNCGSCYAFASTISSSLRRCIASGVSSFNTDQKILSPQYIVDCATVGNYAGIYDHPCAGGYTSQTFSFIALSAPNQYPTCQLNSAGTTCAAGCSPYTSGTCADDGSEGASTQGCPKFKCDATYSCTKPRTSLETYNYRVDSIGVDYLNPAAIKAEISTNGPLAVSFPVCSDFKSFWAANKNKEVVYSGPCHYDSPDLLGGHAVTMLGWKKIGGVDSWILLNQWGNQFANRGIFYMKIGRDIDMDFDGNLYANQAAASEGTYLFDSDFLSPPVGMSADLDLRTNSAVSDVVNSYVAGFTASMFANQEPSTLTHTITRVGSQVVNGQVFAVEGYSTDYFGNIYEHSGKVIDTIDLERTVTFNVPDTTPVSPIVVGLVSAAAAIVIGFSVLIILLVRARRIRQAQAAADVEMTNVAVTDASEVEQLAATGSNPPPINKEAKQRQIDLLRVIAQARLQGNASFARTQTRFQSCDSSDLTSFQQIHSQPHTPCTPPANTGVPRMQFPDPAPSVVEQPSGSDEKL